MLVVGARSHALLSSGRLQHLVERARRLDVPCLGERAFLRRLGLLGSAGPGGPTLAFADLPRLAGLDRTSLELLALFDILQPDDGSCRYRDLVAAREAARLLRGGMRLADLVRGVQALRRAWTSEAGDDQLIARLRQADPSAFHPGTRSGPFDSQMRLKLPEPPGPTADALFEAAFAAEGAEQWQTAEALYRRCLDRDRSDPTVPFNLANVLQRQGRAREAQLHLRRAVARDGRFVDAWYNLALLLEKDGRRIEATDCLHAALRADPRCADALYLLAELRQQDGAHAEAVVLWERYLERDAGSPWSARARRALALCRRLLAATERKPT